MREKARKFNPFSKKRQTLAEKLADRMDEFYDACEGVIKHEADRPMTPRAWKKTHPWLGPADWVRHGRYFQMQAMLDQHSVFAPSVLAGDALGQMASLTAPYIMDDTEFLDLLSVVPDQRARDLRHQRKSWLEALGAPKPPIRVGESASQALARLLAGPTFHDSYELGRKTLGQNMVFQTQEYHFLAPYAIARIRSRGGLGPSDPAAAPPVKELMGSEAFAARMVHRALTAGLDITELTAAVLAQENEGGESFAKVGLAERLYAVQNSASLHLAGTSLPNPLPMGKPRNFGAASLDMFDAAAHLVQHCQLKAV